VVEAIRYIDQEIRGLLVIEVRLTARCSTALLIFAVCLSIARFPETTSFYSVITGVIMYKVIIQQKQV
jgi:hypothetical protein